MAAMLMHSSPQFEAMSQAQRLLVMDRMKRWVIRKEFINKNEQDAPEDVKYIIGYYAVLLTLHQESFLYEQFDRIVFYHHPFLSPAHDEEVHILELEKTDGTIILSVPHLLKGHLEKGYYNIALHAMAEAYRHQYLKSEIDWPTDIKEHLESISNIPYARIEDYLGLPVEDPFPVAVHHQVTYINADIPIITEIFPQLKGWSILSFHQEGAGIQLPGYLNGRIDK